MRYQLSNFLLSCIWEPASLVSHEGTGTGRRLNPTPALPCLSPRPSDKSTECQTYPEASVDGCAGGVLRHSGGAICIDGCDPAPCIVQCANRTAVRGTQGRMDSSSRSSEFPSLEKHQLELFCIQSMCYCQVRGWDCPRLWREISSLWKWC